MGHQRIHFGLASINEWSKEPKGSDTTEEHLSGQVVKKMSRRFTWLLGKQVDSSTICVEEVIAVSTFFLTFVLVD